MSATSSSITSSLPKSPRRNKRKPRALSPAAPIPVSPTGPPNKDNEPAYRDSLLCPPPPPRAASQPADYSALTRTRSAEDTSARRAALAAANLERQQTYDMRLTHAIWALATHNANPAVDLLVCLERRHTIGFRYVDITRSIVMHHGSRDARVPVENVKWLGRTMARCEVRILEGEGHGLMASAAVMGGVLVEIAGEWEDWTRVVKGEGRTRGRSHDTTGGL